MMSKYNTEYEKRISEVKTKIQKIHESRKRNLARTDIDEKDAGKIMPFVSQMRSLKQ